MNKIKLTIGEFSKLCSVTVKTLRHYEKTGLLIPHEVDQWTHYRYYCVEQMELMQRIKELKALGLSLDEVAQMLEDETLVLESTMLQEKIERTKAQIKALNQRLSKLQAMQNPLKKQRTMKTIKIKPLPSGIVASWRTKLNGYAELREKLCTIVLPEMQRLGCVCPAETEYCFTIDYNNNHDPQNIDLEYCEVVKEKGIDSDILKFKDLPLVETAVCIEHRGEYDFTQTMAAAFRFLEENGYAVAEPIRFCYIHGVWDCDSVEDWLTEVQIPVKKG